MSGPAPKVDDDTIRRSHASWPADRPLRELAATLGMVDGEGVVTKGRLNQLRVRLARLGIPVRIPTSAARTVGQKQRNARDPSQTLAALDLARTRRSEKSRAGMLHRSPVATVKANATREEREPGWLKDWRGAKRAIGIFKAYLDREAYIEHPERPTTQLARPTREEAEDCLQSLRDAVRRGPQAAEQWEEAFRPMIRRALAFLGWSGEISEEMLFARACSHWWRWAWKSSDQLPSLPNLVRGDVKRKGGRPAGQTLPEGFRSWAGVARLAAIITLLTSDHINKHGIKQPGWTHVEVAERLGFTERFGWKIHSTARTCPMVSAFAYLGQKLSDSRQWRWRWSREQPAAQAYVQAVRATATVTA